MYIHTYIYIYRLATLDPAKPNIEIDIYVHTYTHNTQHSLTIFLHFRSTHARPSENQQRYRYLSAPWLSGVCASVCTCVCAYVCISVW